MLPMGSILVESKNPNPQTSSYEKAAFAAMTLYYASVWYNREHGPGNWYIPEAFAGKRFRHAWRTIMYERLNDE